MLTSSFIRLTLGGAVALPGAAVMPSSMRRARFLISSGLGMLFEIWNSAEAPGMVEQLSKAVAITQDGKLETE